MSVLLSMVTKNEAHRYLDAALACVKPQVDRMFIWDDQSTDETVEIARSHGAFVAVREEGVPSFVEAEGTFRETGWSRMVTTLDPEPGDWILTLDADEFLLGDIGNAIRRALDHGYSTLRMQIAEGYLLTPLSVRVDGYWGKIDGFRATEYQEGDQSFKRQGLACGTLPSYADHAWNAGSESQIWHAGHVYRNDRQDKYDRYLGVHGHSNAHVESILTTPELVLWDGEAPNIWRGISEETQGSVRR